MNINIIIIKLFPKLLFFDAVKHNTVLLLEFDIIQRNQ